MSPRRRHPRAAVIAALALPIVAPAAIALAAGTDAPPVWFKPASRPPVLVAEQVSTARDIQPLGWSATTPAATTADDGTTPTGDAPRVVWAIGRTRRPSELEDGEQVPPDPGAPATGMLLEGTITSDGAPTAWQRAAPPLDVTGAPLDDDAWRLADGTDRPARPGLPVLGAGDDAQASQANPSLHASAATPRGATALLARIAAADGDHDAVLVRTTDGRFHELPAPPAELESPAPNAFAGAGGATVPIAVFDVPGDADHPDRGRTGVLLAPAGGDGVLRWDGAKWSEEPWQTQAGAAVGAHTALALGATAAGDAVALFAGDPTSSDPSAARVELARRDGAAHAFRSVPLSGSPLLTGPLPKHVTSIAPVAAPGQPLTVGPHDWWIDLAITRDDDGVNVPVSATIHVRPPTTSVASTTPSGPAASTPAATSPDASTPSDGTSPAETSPSATSPGDGSTPTDPEATSPSTPAGTTAPAPPGAAVATGAWCTPTLDASAACDHDLGFRFATTRGYTSAAFDGAGGDATFGERAISSPVLPDADGTTTPREGSASGGFLELERSTFELRSGVGDDGTGGTQAAVFGAGGFAIVGGERAVGRTMPAADAANDAVTTSPAGFSEALDDVALSPAGTPTGDAGAIEVSPLVGFRRQQGTGPWEYTLDAGGVRDGSNDVGAIYGLAWPRPDLLYVAASDGDLADVPVSAISGDPSRRPENAGVRVQQLGHENWLDIAASAADAWAVGRNGALAHRLSSDRSWELVVLTGGLKGANLVNVAYAGADALIASDRGLLVADQRGAVTRDDDLAAMMRDDDRPVAVHAVAGLPDGSAVVDARYIRHGHGPWERLASPAEGDVVALALWREAGNAPADLAPGPLGSSPADSVPASTAANAPTTLGDALGGLRVAASIADIGRPIQGKLVQAHSGMSAAQRDRMRTLPLVEDGRLAVLGPSGWVDRIRTPLARSTGRDLAAWSPPIGAIAVDGTGNGWVAGGQGSFLDYSVGAEAAIAPVSFDAPLGHVALDPRPAEEQPVPTPEDDAASASGTRRQTSVPAIGIDPSVESPVHVLVGGHPACLDDCSGRGDQAIAPDANVDDALATADRLASDDLHGNGPAVLVVGGGRASVGGPGLSRAGARRYVELLRSHGEAVPVLAAIGTGDGQNPASRAAFADAARALIADQAVATTPSAGGTLTPVATPQQMIERHGSDTVAYAYDVATSGDALAARVVVIDNAGGTLRGGADGAQAHWLSQVLADAQQAGESTVVVGAARLDDAGPHADDRDEELTLLGLGGADAYVATDGSDDPSDLRFGDQTASSGIDTTHGGRVELYRTSALGHAQAFVDQFNDLDPSTSGEDGDAAAGTSEPALIDFALSGAGGGAGADASLIPVFQHLVPWVAYEQVGRADFANVVGSGRSGTGFMRPANEVASIDDETEDVPVETTPGTLPEPTSPSGTTPEPTPPASTTPVETRGFTYVDGTPLPCRIFGDDESCRGRLPLDASFTVTDPSIAVFVRARPRTHGGPPDIVADAHGDPVIDPNSAVLCPLRAGTTTIVVHVAGATAAYPLRVTDPAGDTQVPVGEAPCSFIWRETHDEDGPAPTTPTAPPALPAPAPQPVPQLPLPRLQPHPHLASPHTITPLVAPLPFLGGRPMVNPAAPVAPNPKPAAAAPPAPPSGLSAQHAPAQQGAVQTHSSTVQQTATLPQTATVTQEQRQHDVAREGADLHASALAHERPAAARAPQLGHVGARGTAGRIGHADERGAAGEARPAAVGTEPSSPTVPIVAAGGVLALLAALAGRAAGARRRSSRAAARRWLR